MLHHLVEVWYNWVQSGGYWAIIVLMAMESSIIPVPSEVVIPPAAYLAAEGKLSLAGVIIAGTLGSYIGSALSYWISLWIGRPLILRFGKYFLLSPDKIERAEIWLARYEAGGVFFARILPVIRHLISIPAGIVRMNFAVFSLVTILGAGVWCSVLAYLGYHMHAGTATAGPQAMEQFIRHQSLTIVAAAVVLAALYFLMLWLTAKPRTAQGNL